MTIEKMLKGYPIVVQLNLTDFSATPPPGKCWLFLGGMIDHITATETALCFRPKGLPPTASAYSAYMWTIIPAATATSYVNASSIYYPFILTNGDKVTFTGDTAAWACLNFLEFDA
jgi:hypothetical protein